MKRFVSLLIIVLVLAIGGCGNSEQPVKSTESNKKVNVVVSIYPMAQFVKAVGKDRVEVELLIPEGVEAHDWDPTAKDILKAQKSKLFVFNGGGIEPWVEKILPEVESKKVFVLEAGLGLFDEGMEHDEHGHGADDPHIWLDPLLAIKQVKSIREALILIDPEGSDYYNKNAQEYIATIEKIHEDYLALAQKSEQAEFIVMHSAFGYLAKQYGWQQVSLMGMDPHAEPTPADLAKIIETVIDKNIKFVFVEPQMDKRIMQEVAKQANAEILVLDPMENPSKDMDYLQGMKNNLENLHKAFGQE